MTAPLAAGAWPLQVVNLSEAAALRDGGVGPPQTRSSEIAGVDDNPTRRTDAGNGEHFARLYADRVRFDHRRQRRLLWREHWWAEDDMAAVRCLAKDAAHDRYREAEAIADLAERTSEARFAIASENRQRIDAMLLAARSEPPIADAGDHWDADPWLVGVANGVVDLRTGTLRPGDPADQITHRTPIVFDPAATAPRWERFLGEVFDGDAELIAFIARAVGYSLTGSTREQCLFTCYGVGANGKSTFLNVIRRLAGDYGANTPFSTFELTSRSAIPNDVAALAGRRLVTASETSESARLNEARLKALTGGDEVTARFLHGEFFSYRPIAKFWLAVNHKPRVTDDSHGWWRRVRLIPFNRAFEADGDPDLAGKLEAELPGIFAWAVRGALAWQAEGLRSPAAVVAATEEYRLESDPLVDFLEQRCVELADAELPSTAAHRAYKTWAADAGLSDREQMTSTLFGRRMKTRFASVHRRGGSVYLGVGLAADDLRELRTQEPEGRVTGSVTGSEHDRAQDLVLPLVDALSREESESAVTTCHLSPTSKGASR